jgi:hypothetical protein
MPHFSNNVYVQTSTMTIPLIQGGHTMPYFNAYMSSFIVDACVTQGGYTNLLLGVHQDASSAVRKLHFDGVPNNENI